MDRDALIRALPTQKQLQNGGEVGRKQAAEDFIRAILADIADERREPDDWEAQDIAAAIGFLAARMYYASLAYAERALTPPEGRAPIALKNPQDPPSSAQLSKALDHVSMLPAKNF